MQKNKNSNSLCEKGTEQQSLSINLEALEKKALIQTAACQSMVGYDLPLLTLTRHEITVVQEESKQHRQVSCFDIISNHAVFLKKQFFLAAG